MSRLDFGFDLADGTALNTTNVPGATLVTGSAGSSQQASNLHPWNGVNGARFSAPASGNSVIRVPVTPNSNVAAVRKYYWYSGTPPVAVQDILALRHSAGISSRINLTNSGTFRVQNTSATVTLFTTAALTTGTYRLEMWETVDTGVLHFAYFLGDDIIPVQAEYVSPAGQLLGPGIITHVDLGRISTPAQASDVFVNFLATDGGLAGFIGPIGGGLTAAPIDLQGLTDTQVVVMSAATVITDTMTVLDMPNKEILDISWGLTDVTGITETAETFEDLALTVADGVALADTTASDAAVIVTAATSTVALVDAVTTQWVGAVAAYVRTVAVVISQ